MARALVLVCCISVCIERRAPETPAGEHCGAKLWLTPEDLVRIETGPLRLCSLQVALSRKSLEMAFPAREGHTVELAPDGGIPPGSELVLGPEAFGVDLRHWSVHGMGRVECAPCAQ
jgi:hypothetical protein